MFYTHGSFHAFDAILTTLVCLGKVKRCLQDTGSRFIVIQLHPRSILSIYFVYMKPIKIIFKFESFQNEFPPNRSNVIQISCKGVTSSFWYGIRNAVHRCFTAFFLQNEGASVLTRNEICVSHRNETHSGII